MTKIEVLQQCTVEGNIVKLPSIQLERKLYKDVAKALELIGGKWKGGKIFGFVFPADPTELIAKISEGENVNLKKEFQFFETPSKICDRLIELAEIQLYHTILEPSAGQGAIIKAITSKYNIIPDCYEIMETNRMILENRTKDNGIKCHVLGNDFLELAGDKRYDRIIANPPFSKNQDIDHIYQMYKCLKSGGKMVSIASNHWQLSNNKKETEFREWLNDKNADIQEIPVGEFKESGTMIASCIIVILK
jgi:hypothetical protein